MVATSSILYTVSFVLFHKYIGENVAFTNYMSHFSIFVPTKYYLKLANGNMVHAQVIGIILCHFTKFLNIYLMVPVYYCPGHPSNAISSCDLKFYLGFQNVTSENLEHCDFVYPQNSY